ncbi:MAG: methyltransferase domain-containing protein [Bacillota bacterium]
MDRHSPEDVRSFFDGLAARWDQLPRPAPERLQVIVDWAALSSGETVLDVGTGTGILVPYLRRGVGPGGEVVGADISQRMLEQAEANHGEAATFVLADAQYLPFPAGRFDCVMCFSAFPHFDHQFRAIGEFARVLRPGGRVVIAHADSRSTINARHQGMGGPAAHHVLPPAPVLAGWLEACGLKASIARDDSELFVIVGRKAPWTRGGPGNGHVL